MTLDLRRYESVRSSAETYSPPNFHSSFVIFVINDEPRYIKEVVNSKEDKLYKKSMLEEMKALDKNESWDLVEFLDGRKHVGSKWVFKKKVNVARKVEEYKDCLVTKEHS